MRFLNNHMRFAQKRRVLRSLLCLFLLALAATACQTLQGGTGDPSKAVEDYLAAMVKNETDKLPQLVCPNYEAGAKTDFDSLGAIGGVTLDGVDCSTVSTNGDSATVTCTGALKFTYNGEAQSQDLAGNVYATSKVDGAWKMCGYQ
jgi:hypothetical protein